MNKMMLAGCLIFFTGLSTALAGMSTDDMAKNILKIFNDMADDTEKAKVASDLQPKLGKHMDNMDKAAREMKKATKSPDEDAKLKEKYQPDMIKAQTRFAAAMKGLMERDPEGTKTLFENMRKLDQERKSRVEKESTEQKK